MNIVKNKYFYISSLFIFLNIYFILFIPYSPINQCSAYFGDISLYLNIAKETLAGRTLYSEIFDQKGPLLHFIFIIPHLFKNVDITMFILTMILLNLIFIFSYKTIKYFSGNKIFITSILLFEAISLQFEPNLIFGPEGLALLVTTYVSYWVLTEKYKNPKNISLIICGILTAMMFWIKFTYVTYIGIIFLFFIYMRIKESKFNYKDILMPLIGFLIITIPILIYLILNGILKDMFDTYFILNSKYKNTLSFDIDFKFILLLLLNIVPLIYGIKNKNNELISLSVAYFVLMIFVFIMPKNNWNNLYIPFISLFLMFSLIKFNINKFLQKFILLILFAILIFFSSSNVKDYRLLKNDRNNYVTMTDKIEKNSIVMSSLVGNNLTENIENFNYKYFYMPVFTYGQFPELFDTIHNDIKNKNIDYIVIVMKYNKIHMFERCEQDPETFKKVEEITKDLYNNYDRIEKIGAHHLFKAKK